MLVSPAPIVAYIVCFTYLDSSTIKSQLPELVHSFTTDFGEAIEYGEQYINERQELWQTIEHNPLSGYSG